MRLRQVGLSENLLKFCVLLLAHTKIVLVWCVAKLFYTFKIKIRV